MRLALPQRSIQGIHLFVGTTTVAAGHNLLVLQYRTIPMCMALRQSSPWQHSCQIPTRVVFRVHRYSLALPWTHVGERTRTVLDNYWYINAICLYRNPITFMLVYILRQTSAPCQNVSCIKKSIFSTSIILSRPTACSAVIMVHGLYCVMLTVGTYSLGNLFVVYEISRHVFPTAPSPTTTHLMVCIAPVCTCKTLYCTYNDTSMATKWIRHAIQ